MITSKLCVKFCMSMFSKSVQIYQSVGQENRRAKNKPSFYVFDKEYVYKERQTKDSATRSDALRCYYVVCKSKNGENEYFVCRDLAKVFGSKKRILPEINIDEDAYTLYKVEVRQPDILDLEGWEKIEEMDHGREIMAEWTDGGERH